MRAQSYPTIRLGEAVDRVTKGTTPTTHGYSYTNEGVSFLRVENLQNGVIDTSKVKTFISPEADRFLKRSSLESGDVLISIAGTIGRTAIVRDHDIPANTNQAVAIIRGAAKKFEPLYLRFALESPLLHHHITGEARGGAMQNISLENVRDVVVPLPPLPEQRRIVAEIEKQFSRLEEGVSALKRVQANLKRYRAAVLKAACEGRLVETEAELYRKRKTKSSKLGFETGEQLVKRILDERRKAWKGRAQYKEPIAPDTTILSHLPEGWTWATLDSLAEIKGGITKDQNRKYSVPTRSVPYLRVGNVQRGYIDLKEVKEIVTTEDEIRELALKPGDILLNEGGDRDKLGRGWVWNGELPECIHQNHVFRARLYVGELNSKLVSWYANTFGQKFFFDEGKHTTNLASISMSKLKGLPVPIPPPAEQKRIVEEVERRLSVVEELESLVTTNLQRAARLRQAVLQKAFEGKLTSEGENS